MTLNKKLTTALGYEIYGKEKKSNFGEALIEFALVLAFVLLAWFYLVAFY